MINAEFLDHQRHHKRAELRARKELMYDYLCLRYDWLTLFGALVCRLGLHPTTLIFQHTVTSPNSRHVFILSLASKLIAHCLTQLSGLAAKFWATENEALHDQLFAFFSCHH